MLVKDITGNERITIAYDDSTKTKYLELGDCRTVKDCCTDGILDDWMTG